MTFCGILHRYDDCVKYFIACITIDLKYSLLILMKCSPRYSLKIGLEFSLYKNVQLKPVPSSMPLEVLTICKSRTNSISDGIAEAHYIIILFFLHVHSPGHTNVFSSQVWYKDV